MIRQMLVASILPISLLAACGDDGGGTITPTGAHHHYVVDKAFIPKTPQDVTATGLDVDGIEGTDNALGNALQLLGGQGLDIQTSIDGAINEGTINLLANVQTASFDSSGGAGLQVHLGSNPMPAPCTDPNTPTTCGQHLKGTGMFTAGTAEAAVAGKIVNGVFNGGSLDETLNLQISIAGATINLNLIAAHAQIQGMTEEKITSAIVAGAVSNDDIQTMILPAIHSMLDPLIGQTCTKGGTNAPAGSDGSDCGCTSGGTGAKVLMIFDKAPTKDCKISLDEVKNNGLVMSFLQPDVTINGVQSLSVGLKFSAVKATYTVAGETE